MKIPCYIASVEIPSEIYKNKTRCSSTKSEVINLSVNRTNYIICHVNLAAVV